MTAILLDPPRARFPDLWRRLISAAVLIPFGLLCIRVGPAWDALMVLAAMGLLRELRRLALSRAATGMGAVAIVLAGGSLIWLRSDAVAGYGNVLFTAVIVWVGDMAAYAAGRAVGGRKLAPSVSPAKTWAGALGGLAAAVIAGVALGGDVRAGAAAAVLAVFAQAGDLVESAAKRQAGVKDTGGLIPGHGGLLDRLDGMLAAAPIAALLAAVAGPGAPLWAALG